MSSAKQKRSEVVVARSKRTHDKYPTRTSHLAGSGKASSSSTSYLHYTDDSRLYACRCSCPQDHERAYPVSEDHRNLANAVIRYMDKLGIDSCHQPNFYQYFEQQKIELALNGVRAERFHYFRKNKDIVCRCSSIEHRGYRRVQDPEIRELCAAFFTSNTTKTICTREQWRAMKTNLQERARLSPILSPASTAQFVCLSTPRKDSFEYDSPSMVDLLNFLEKRPRSSHKHHSQRCSEARSLSSDKSCLHGHMVHLSSGQDGEVDIPKDVWRVSRPSVYLGQHRTNSVMSTPLGSSITPVAMDVAPELRGRRPPTLYLVPETFESRSSGSAWDGDCAFRSSSSWQSSPFQPPTSPRYDADRSGPDIHIAGLEVSSSETLRSSTSGSMSRPCSHSVGHLTHVAELPSHGSGMAVELDATPTHPLPLPHHSPTLRELEGGSCVAELSGTHVSARALRPM